MAQHGIKKDKGGKTENEVAPSGSGGFLGYALLAVVLAAGAAFWSAPDLLNGASDAWMPTTVVSAWNMQLAVGAFCMSGVGEKLGKTKQATTSRHYEKSEDKAFVDDGKVSEDEYQKASIYSVLYSLYAHHPNLNYHVTNETYQFTFNTWGLYREDGNDDGQGNQWYDEKVPERVGMTAYRGLVEFDEVKKYLSEVNAEPTFLEVGCGTGAGANLISGVLTKDPTHPMKKCTYNALDMQGAAIATCKNRHAANNSNLNCVHGNGQKLPFEDSSIDIVVVSETHIAEITLDPEAIKIIGEIKRVLKNGGLFVWGNALPTTAWNEAISYLPTVGFEMKHVNNRTDDGVYARDVDKDRVDHILEQFLAPIYAFAFAPKCKHTIDRLIANFYRHPGTDLYYKMATGTDSYMHICGKLSK